MFEKLEGSLDTTPASATPFVNDEVTVAATFTPSGAQSAAGRDVTFQVFRRSELSGAAYPRVKNAVVQTEASGVARYTYRGTVLASDVVVACLAYGDSCLRDADTSLAFDSEGAQTNLGRGSRWTARRWIGGSATTRRSGSPCGTARRSPVGITLVPARSTA